MKPCIILSCVLALLAVVSWFAIDWSEAGADTYAGGTVLRDAGGEVLRVALGPGDVDCRPYYRASPDDWIVKALVASEDGTFFSHRGVRPFSILRAFIQNVLSRRRVSGASTLTMQTVRLISPHPKTYWWKWKEAVMAAKMELRKDKLWILSQYLNRAPFGSNLVGIEAAANGWLGKGAKALGPGEAALLAGMVQAPSRFRPDRGYAKALARRDYVLARMRKLGYLTDGQLADASRIRPQICRAPRPFRFPSYCDWFMSELGRGGGRAASGDFVTPLDPDVQEFADAAVNEAAKETGVSVAAVVMNVRTDELIALAVSGDYFSQEAGQVNTALAPRPAGSVLKPLLARLALDEGLLSPDEKLEDRPRAFGDYRPANFDGTYRGEVTLRDALVQSLNLPFVNLLERVGVGRFGASLRAQGFRHVREPVADYGLGLAIGNAEITLVELVRAYAAFARDAVQSPNARLVTEMLSGEERSPAALGHVAAVKVPRFAWKTGTSSAYRDAWTVAWNPDYAVGVWCGRLAGGFGDRTVLGLKAAAPVCWRIARSLYPDGEGPWYLD